METLENKMMLLEFMKMWHFSSSNEMNWEFLIALVEKIESLRDGENIIATVTMQGNYCEIQTSTGIFESEGSTKREAVYNACVEFIKWYTK